MTGAVLSTLDRKLWRDLWGMRGQALAIALVIAAGVCVHVIIAGMLASLEETQRAYYERYRFADIWAGTVRAPESLGEEIRAIEGVAAAETRLMAPILFDMEDMAAPASGVIHSLPRGREPTVSHIHLSEGRMPDPERRDEAVVLDSFAAAHDLQIGDRLSVTIRGRQESLRITGKALSPEYIYAVAPGQFIPDARLFGVLWMDRRALERAADLDGAFNLVALRLMRGADAAPVIDELDRLLDPYGAPGAYERREHVSHAFLQSELDQLRTMGDVLPPIFLAVAAFLVNVVMTRLVAVEREQIGLMKAFGYSSGRVAWHYLKLAGIIALTGLLLGLGVGVWLGRLMAGMYVIYYNFPFLVFAATPAVYLIGVGVTALAAGGGAFIAVRRAARLEPAVAMRPPPPPDYSRAAGSAVTRWKLLDQQTRMILRQIIRWPVRSGLTVLGIGLSGALLLMTLYFVDAMEELITNYFDESARHDLAVSFVEPRGMDAFHDLMRREGVIYGEPFRAVGASLRFQNREVRLGLTGVVAEPALNRMVDAQDQGVAPAPGGLLLSQDIAERLGARPGDVIRAEVSEGRRPDLDLPVVAAPLVLIGSGAQMRLEELNAALGEGRVISGAWLKVDPDRLDTLYDELKAAPLVAGVELHHESRTTFKELMDRSIGVTIFIYTIFAGLIALGVIYNAVRISFAERARELASLRVLGFSRADVSYILLGEAGLLTLAAIPVGLVLGTGLSWFMAGAMSSDMFRLPFVIEPSSYAYCALVLAVIAAGSALIVRRRIDRLNLVEVLKTRE